MLEIARVLWANQGDLRRSVRIAWWPGHSTGRYAGSAWFADTFAIDLDEHCVAQINCDSPGCRWADVYENVAWMSETEDLCKDVIRAVTGQESHGERPLRAGDYSFNNIGLTSFFMLSSTMTEEKRREMSYYTVGGCGGNIAWHTENDILEIADRQVLLRDIKLYLAAVMSVKVVASLDEAIDHIERYGSHHTDAILTRDHGNAMRFLREVDSASVMVNASTRFADGFEYGLGAEIGISTNKLHARGPVGLEGLTSRKWIVLGDGHVRG